METELQLLRYLRDHPRDRDAWYRFDDLYRPVISRWLDYVRLQAADAEDLLQQVLNASPFKMNHLFVS